MFSLSRNGILTFNKGDSFSIPLFINKGTDICPIRYEVTGKDQVVLAITQPQQVFYHSSITKIFTEADKNEQGDVMISISGKDTCYLPGGLYYYQIKLRKYNLETNEYDVITITNKNQLYLIEE